MPKTAGLSFKAMLMNVYGEERVYQDNADVPMNPTMPDHVDRAGWRAAADAEIRAIGPEIRAVHGHFVVEKYENAFPEAPRIA